MCIYIYRDSCNYTHTYTNIYIYYIYIYIYIYTFRGVRGCLYISTQTTMDIYINKFI